MQPHYINFRLIDVVRKTLPHRRRRSLTAQPRRAFNRLDNERSLSGALRAIEASSTTTRKLTPCGIFRIPRVAQLFNAVHQAIRRPLAVHFHPRHPHRFEETTRGDRTIAVRGQAQRICASRGPKRTRQPGAFNAIRQSNSAAASWKSECG